jgi:hypothetical protein
MAPDRQQIASHWRAGVRPGAAEHEAIAGITFDRPASAESGQARYTAEQLKELYRRGLCELIGAALDLCRLEGVAKSLIFDGNDYTERCLRQVRVGSQLPSLVDRYALDQRHLNVPDQELFDWIEQVVALWQRQADQGVVMIADVCEQLLAADEDLRVAPDYRDAEWWRELIRETQPAAANPSARPGRAGRAAAPLRPDRAAPQPGTSPPAAPSPPRRRQEEIPIADQPVPVGQPGAGAESRLPPPPVMNVTAEPRDDRVVVRWQAPPDAPNAVKFVVERLTGPGVEGCRWRTSGTVVEDREPPVGRPLVYEVVVHDPDGTQSNGTRAGAVFTPQVTGLVARQVSNGGVTGRWRTRGNIRETQVWRTPAGSSADPADGASVPSQPDTFHDHGAPPGRHVYSVVPIYQDPETRATYRGRYSSVEVEVVGRPPLPRVDIAEGPLRGGSDLVLRWDQLPADVSLLLRRAAAEPAGAARDALTLEEAGRIGEPVAVWEALSGTSARVTVPAGQWSLIPFSVAGNIAVRGRSLLVVVVPRVKNPEAVRNGPNVLVSWEWPEGLRLASVTWRTGDAELVREVTLNEFRRLGGVAFEGSEAAEAEISGVVRSGTDELISAPVTVRVAPQTPTLTFHVRHVWPWELRRPRPYRLHGPRWWCARRQIVVTADLPCAGLRLEVYVRTPTVGADTEEPVCAVDGLELGPDHSYEVTVSLPDLSAMDRPRYLACRAATLSGPVRVNEFASTGREIRPCFRFR